MRGLGMFLLVVGAICACIVHPYLGIALVIVGLLFVIAGGGEKKPIQVVPSHICAGCGNPVEPTANLCPTCHMALTPSLGPLAPKREARSWDGKGYCPDCGRDTGHMLACPRYGK
jgi:hypothetical protein